MKLSFLFIDGFFRMMMEGGPFYMYPILLLLIVCLILTFKSKDSLEKTRKLISSFSLLALVWGFLGQLIGLVGAFEAIAVATEISPNVLAMGLRISMYPTIFGLTTFLIARLCIIGLTIRDK